MRPDLVPKLFTVFRQGYGKEQLRRDVLAGIVVGIVALPLSIAFAIASGVSPEKGLITAIVAGFFISAFGGSRVQVGGPTGAFIVIVYGIVQAHGVEGLTIATLMAGVLLVIMGLLRFGALLRYFPHTLIVGFTSGIAVIIFSSQMNDLLGLRLTNVPADFLGKWALFASHVSDIQPLSVVIAVGTIVVTLLMTRVSTVVPGAARCVLLVDVGGGSLFLFGHSCALRSRLGADRSGCARPGPGQHRTARAARPR
ncbi:MAG: hypothetical protein IPJ76_12275 [Flavobacteriales bacterium]|nr:MAG: hypothetical protein IPJ76_12275 [Flavobacteriales bacterium]